MLSSADRYVPPVQFSCSTRRVPEARHRLHRVPLIGVPNAALSGPARFQRAMARRHGAEEPGSLDRPPTLVPEEFFAFQAFAAPHAA